MPRRSTRGLVNSLKGVSARRLRQEFPELARLAAGEPLRTRPAGEQGTARLLVRARSTLAIWWQ